MSDPVALGVFAVIIWGGYVVQTVTGFGVMIVAITLGALVVPIEQIAAVAVPLSMVQTGWIVIRHRDGIAWRLVSRRVVPLMVVGMLAGFALSEQVRGEPLRIAFGVLVLLLSARELRSALRVVVVAERPVGPIATTAALLGAGVVHGIYATGGPLLVYAIGRQGLGKHALRSTLTMVWLLLNAGLTGMMAFRGRVDGDTLLTTAMLLPTVPLGILVGEVVHRRVSERRFRVLLFSLLAVAAVVLIIHSARARG